MKKTVMLILLLGFIVCIFGCTPKVEHEIHQESDTEWGESSSTVVE